MKKSLLVLLMVAVLMSGLFAQGASEAASFPSKTVEATVGWSAGGGGDIVFRALADVFPKYANGQTIIIYMLRKTLTLACGMIAAFYLDK